MQRMTSFHRAIVLSIALTLTLGLLALTAPAFADGARILSIDNAAAVSQEVTNLESEVVPPERVFIQKTSQFPQRGNVLVIIELSDEARAEKSAEGKNFITLGEEAAQILARDDGQGGDAKAGDGLFTAIAHVDDQQLVERADADSAALAAKGNNTEVVFDGRVQAGTATVSPFDVDGFLAGKRVELDQAVVLSEEERLAEEEAEPTALKVTGASHVPGTNTFQDRVLMIRDLGVVQDPQRTWNPCDGSGNPFGVWTFNHLMTEMANRQASGIEPAAFVEEWLKTWTENPGPTINSFTVSTRLQMQVIIDQWRQASGGGALDLAKSPLRLLAIVPRVDLRKTTSGGGGYNGNVSGNFLDAGEARFVFGFVAPPEWDPNLGFIGEVPIQGQPGCRALLFTVILEYKVPKCDCFDVRGWARQWVSLANLVPGTNAYNSRLENLTQQFARRNADPRRPNGSSIGQVRTNEVALPQDEPVPTVVWELREFQLTQNPFSLLQETTTADTPHDSFNGVINPTPPPHLFDWIQVVKNSVNQPPVPLFFQGSGSTPVNFMGPNPQVPEANPAVITYHWNHPFVTHPGDNQARFDVSVATCSGCHRGDTGTPFVQIDPANAATNGVLPAPISGFLSGIAWADPAFGTPTRHFDDLHRREKDIRRVAAMRCFRFHPIHVQHVQQSLRSGGGLPDDLFGNEPPVPLDQRPALGVDDMRRNPVPQVH